MGTKPFDTSDIYHKNFRFKTTDVFDRTLVGRIYSEFNCEEWYDILYRLSPEEVKKQCRLFHLEIILNCPQMTQRYDALLCKNLAVLN